MHVRDAVEADAEAIASLAGQPTAAARNLVHDRSVRVGVADDVADPDPDPNGALDAEDLLGFVAFDAGRNAVHVTGFGGTQDAVERLLGEPARFAAREEMAIEALVEAGEEGRRAAVEAAGFEDVGSGPLFDGSPTRRYRLEPESVDAVDQL